MFLSRIDKNIRNYHQIASFIWSSGKFVKVVRKKTTTKNMMVYKHTFKPLIISHSCGDWLKSLRYACDLELFSHKTICIHSSLATKM